MAPRVVMAGISGATCSGKTTLAKHLARIIPSSLLLFQDDFAPPAEQIPVDAEHGWQDWDDAKGAILWDKQRDTLRQIRETGKVPDEHFSHDAFNEQYLGPVPISDEVQQVWRKKFEELLERQEGDKPCVLALSSRLQLASQADSPSPTGPSSSPRASSCSSTRRACVSSTCASSCERTMPFSSSDERIGTVTCVPLSPRRALASRPQLTSILPSTYAAHGRCVSLPSLILISPRCAYSTSLTVLADAEGSLWKVRLSPSPSLSSPTPTDARTCAQDPPEYWDKCVWPAYLRAHAPLFLSHDVEHGAVDPSTIEGVQLLEANELGMEAMVVRACEVIYEAVESGKGRERWTAP